MRRNTKPQLEPESATDEQKAALKPFLVLVEKEPATVLEALSLLQENPENEITAKPLRKILGIIGTVLETGVDLEVQPDPETTNAMREAIKHIDKRDSSERRLARLAVYAQATQAWQEQQENTAAAIAANDR